VQRCKQESKLSIKLVHSAIDDAKRWTQSVLGYKLVIAEPRRIIPASSFQPAVKVQ